MITAGVECLVPGTQNVVALIITKIELKTSPLYLLLGLHSPREVQKEGLLPHFTDGSVKICSSPGPISGRRQTLKKNKTLN